MNEQPDSVTTKILNERKRILIFYLRSKADEEDWHAVADAAMDLREVDVMLRYTVLYNR